MVKTYKELELVDNFMFCKVMSTNPDLARHLVELIIGSPIRKISIVESEKPMDIHPKVKGIRMDIYMDDEAGTIYDLEMQTTANRDLAKRARYYQGILDLHNLERGGQYRNLPKSVILFICTFDYFGADLPIYAFENRCIQETERLLGDETSKIFVNLASHKSIAEPELRSLFEFFNHNITNDQFTKQLQSAVETARGNDKWEVEYMQLRAYEMDMESDREDAVREGRKEGLEQGLEQGKKEGLKEGERIMLFRLVDSGILTLEQAIQQSGMDKESFGEMYQQYLNGNKKEQS